jgi:uncharacterized protein YdcH (DUF465 family)
MEADEVRLIESLISDNDELRQLWQDHQYLNQKLDAMSAQTYLTAEEQLQRRQMQKRKLAGRDRIAAILAEHNKK